MNLFFAPFPLSSGFPCFFPSWSLPCGLLPSACSASLLMILQFRRRPTSVSSQMIAAQLLFHSKHCGFLLGGPASLFPASGTIPVEIPRLFLFGTPATPVCRRPSHLPVLFFTDPTQPPPPSGPTLPPRKNRLPCAPSSSCAEVKLLLLLPLHLALSSFHRLDARTFNTPFCAPAFEARRSSFS